MSAVANTSATISPAAGWIRGRGFDGLFIFGAVAIALAAGGIGAIHEELLWAVLMLNIVLLGHHHVVATFTRLVFDGESFRRYWVLVTLLPAAILAATIGAVSFVGMWVLPTIYLYWQWFHYTRQSYGIERIYRRKADPVVHISDKATVWPLYLVPFWGILHRSFQAQPKFLQYEVAYLPAPFWLDVAAGMAAAAGLTWWLLDRTHAARSGKISWPHAFYVASHHVIFLTGYIFMADITAGWLVINVWHNSQYILLVWSFNNSRFQAGVDPRAKFLSTMSQTRHLLLYFGMCLALSLILFFGTTLFAREYVAENTVAVTLVVFMVLNFHHYVVDSVIWKLRKTEVRRHFAAP